MKHLRPSTHRRFALPHAAIAALLATAHFARAVTYQVDLGDTFIESGVLSSNTGLTKTGLGTLHLANNGNSYTGATLIEGGTVVISGTGAFGNTSSITVAAAPDGGGTAQLLLAGSYAPSVFDFSAFGGLSLAGGPGVIGQALTSIGNNTIVGPIAASSTTTTRLYSNFGTATVSDYTIGAGARSYFAGNAHWQLSGLKGSGTFEKQSLGTLVLTGANLNSGPVEITAGFVRVSSAANLGTNTSATSIGFRGGALEVRTDAPDFAGKKVGFINGDGSIFLDHSVGGSAMNQNVAFSDLRLSAGRNLTITARNGYGASFTGAGGTIGGGGAGANTITYTGSGLLTLDGNLWNNADDTARTLTFAGTGGNTRVTGSILAPSTAAHQLTKTGTGRLTIEGTASTYRGVTDIQQGTLAIRGFGSIGDPALNTSAIRFGSTGITGTLDFIGSGGTTARPLILNSTGNSGRINANQSGVGATPLLFTGNLTAPATGTAFRRLTLAGSSPLDNEFAGVIADAASAQVTLLKAGAGTWVLSGSNTYTASTTLSGGVLKLRANAAASNVIHDSSIIFLTSDTEGRANSTLEFIGLPDTFTQENLGALQPSNVGAPTIKVTPGAGGSALLTFASLTGPGSAGPNINFVGPPSIGVVRIASLPTGFTSAAMYVNGADFAYSDGGFLRAPVYGSDAGFVSNAAALTTGAHNQITGSFTSAVTSIRSLKIAGSQTLTLTGILAINNGVGSSGGILVTGRNATIQGGAITHGGGAAGSGGIAIRVDGPGDSLILDTAITNTTVGGLTKNGEGTLILRQANNQTGQTNLQQGTIRLEGAGRLSAANQQLNMREGTVLDLNGISTGNTISQFNGTGRVTNSSSAAAVLTVGNNGGSGSFSGVFEDGVGRVSVVKESTNTLGIGGVSTYTGSTTIRSTGALSVTTLADIGQPSGIGRGDATSEVTNAASLVFEGALSGGLGAGLNYTGTESISTDRLFTLGGTVSQAGGRITVNSLGNAALVLRNPAPIAYTPGANAVAQTLNLSGLSTGENRLDPRLINPAGGGTAVLGVLKSGTGVWVLGNDANSYTGHTNISGGTLVAREGASLPSGSPVTFTGAGSASAAVLQVSGNFVRSLNPAALPGSGGVMWEGSGGFAAAETKLTVNLGGGAPLSWGTGGFVQTTGTVTPALILNSATSLAETEFRNDVDLGAANRPVQVNENTSTSLDFATLSGVLSGAGGGLTKAGGGTLQLLGANTYSGDTFLNTGSLVVTSIGNTTSPTSGVGSGGAVRFGGTASLIFVGGGEDADRPIFLGTVGATTATIESSGSGPLILRGVVNSSTGARTLTLRGANSDSNEIASPLANFGVPLGLTKSDAGTWILSGGNSYTGNTLVVGGNLGVGNPSAFGGSTVNLSSARIFAANADRTIANNLALAGSVVTGVFGDHSLTVNGEVSFGEVIPGSPSPAGNTTLTNNISPGSQLVLAGLVRSASTSATRTLIFEGPGTTVISGTVSDSTAARATSLRLVEGTLVLSGNHTYSGSTAVTGGTMRVSGSIAQTASVLLDGAGAHLNVTGSINPAAVTTVENGTLSGTGSTGPVMTSTATTDVTIAPGNSIGILTVQGTATTPGLDLSQGTGAVLSIELGKVIPGSTVLGPGVDYDQIVVAGDTASLNRIVLGFDASLELTIPSVLSIDVGDVFYIAVNNANSEPVSGAFASLPEGATVFAGDGTPFTITYQADWTGTQTGSSTTGGNDIAVVAVPEPTTAASLLVGALGLLGFRGRRRSL